MPFNASSKNGPFSLPSACMRYSSHRPRSSVRYTMYRPSGDQAGYTQFTATSASGQLRVSCARP